VLTRGGMHGIVGDRRARRRRTISGVRRSFAEAAGPDARLAGDWRRHSSVGSEDNNMISKYVKFAVAGIALAMLGATAARADALADIKSKGTLVVGTKADYRPFGYLDPSGKIVGFEPDLAADLAKRLGVKLELVPVVASNRIQFLQQGKIDLMIATTSDTPDRRKIIDFVDPNYYGSGTNVMALKSAGIKSWSDLKGKKVCLIQGSFYNKELQEKYGVEGVAFPGTAEAYAALKNGNCVGFAYDDTAIIGQLQTPEWSNYEMPLDSILFQPWGIGVKQGEPNLLKFVSDATIAWHKSGEIAKLEKKWGIKPTKFAEEMHDKYK
jgi:polar amino acid transport system substrate-binding protein